VSSVRATNNANRSGSWTLQGSSLSSNRYIYVNAPSNTVKVQFWLDKATSATANRTENSSPWDFSGTNGSLELPWNASGTWAGTHTLIVHATLSSGAVESVTVTFTTK
jgi:hypothetical protein